MWGHCHRDLAPGLFAKARLRVRQRLALRVGRRSLGLFGCRPRQSGSFLDYHLWWGHFPGKQKFLATTWLYSNLVKNAKASFMIIDFLFLNFLRGGVELRVELQAEAKFESIYSLDDPNTWLPIPTDYAWNWQVAGRRIFADLTKEKLYLLWRLVEDE